MKLDAKNKCDFSLVLKVCMEFDDVTSAVKLFHVRAAATGNARSPTVDSRGRPMPTSTMTAGVVDWESWRPAEGRRPGRPMLVQVQVIGQSIPVRIIPRDDTHYGPVYRNNPPPPEINPPAKTWSSAYLRDSFQASLSVSCLHIIM